MTIQETLDEAKAAYHELLTGRAVAEFRDQNGETVRYQAANAFRLAAYIQELENKLSTECRPSAPMQFWGR
ncbi:gpW family head-tail joining protein [Mesorhizobium sp.]|uniref:gpW family head-tail joining protein n=1 Tax=Mesorhizobium sp. TaxID=1871066 RepID=UPI000FE59318|nr:gpW family head-tail joining protein [Mesorhizobium sp.]RWE33897.1 MAG: phage tail protein [Mesorhizobium sp.]